MLPQLIRILHEAECFQDKELACHFDNERSTNALHVFWGSEHNRSTKQAQRKHTQSIHTSTSDILGVCNLSGHPEVDPSVILFSNKGEVEEGRNT